VRDPSYLVMFSAHSRSRCPGEGSFLYGIGPAAPVRVPALTWLRSSRRSLFCRSTWGPVGQPCAVVIRRSGRSLKST